METYAAERPTSAMSWRSSRSKGVKRAHLLADRGHVDVVCKRYCCGRVLHLGVAEIHT